MPAAPVRAPALWILAAGVLAATIDIAYAIGWSLAHGGTAEKLLQAVASGWQGKAAFEGGWASAALGLASHYGILLFAAALFLAASRRLPWLRAHPVLAGLLYGLAIFLFMNFVVLPLSAIPFRMRYSLVSTGGDLISHLVGVGLSISLLTRRAFISSLTRP